ncbi:MAG: ribbon-helix-helix domain-containing protein [Bacteroidota bacterium]
MPTFSFHIDDSLNNQLKTLACDKERSKAYIVRKAVENYLSEQNDLSVVQKALEEFYNSGLKTYSLDQIKKENDLWQPLRIRCN